MNINKQSGLTIVELMISLLIGVIIIFGLGVLINNANRVTLLTDSLSTPQENGRFIMSLLGKQIRQAGTDTVATAPNGGLYSRETEMFFNCSDTTLCNSNNVGPDKNDILSIQFTPNKNSLLDCTNKGLGINNVDELIDEIVNVFWVEGGSFYCRGYNKTMSLWISDKTELARNIDGLQVLYGESVPVVNKVNERQITKFVAADNITNWNTIIAVRIGLLIRSSEEVLDPVEKKYFLLDGETYSYDDGAPRQIFVSTFALKNPQPRS